MIRNLKLGVERQLKKIGKALIKMVALQAQRTSLVPLKPCKVKTKKHTGHNTLVISAWGETEADGSLGLSGQPVLLPF